MKTFFNIVVCFYFLFLNLGNAQSFSFHGGYGVGSHWGSHFSVKSDILLKNKWNFGINYSLVKQIDNRAHPRNFIGFHLVNERDQTFIEFQELNRGYIIQKQERDPRPNNLTHRFSLFAGYKIVDNKHFLSSLYFGPHFSMDRTILDNVFQEFTTVIEKEGEAAKILPYSDWQIYRSWDVGVGSRLEAEYKLFQNVSIGLSSQMFFDVLQEGIDLVVGGGITYHFTPSKN